MATFRLLASGSPRASQAGSTWSLGCGVCHSLTFLLLVIVLVVTSKQSLICPGGVALLWPGSWAEVGEGSGAKEKQLRAE